MLGALVAAVSIAACGGSPDSSQAKSQSSGSSKTTTTAFKKAGWADRITVSYRKSSIRFRASGIPNHSRSAYYAVGNGGTIVPTAGDSSPVADPTQAQNYDYSIPNKPVWRKKVTSAPLGSIGFMISGAVLFNPHAITGEEGGLGGVDAEQVAAKAAYDPAGLLNPGKLRGWLERQAGASPGAALGAHAA